MEVSRERRRGTNTCHPRSRLLGVQRVVCRDGAITRSAGAHCFGSGLQRQLVWRPRVGSIGQTLATREADCSEFSALFVAMARSLGLPARIVSGLAYSGNSFGGHAWVEVWAGKCSELDPSW